MRAASFLLDGLEGFTRAEVEDALEKRLFKCIIAAFHTLPDPQLDTSEGLFMSDDPQVNFWDFSQLPEESAISRFKGEMVLIVIDEARALIFNHSCGVNFFRCYRSALERLKARWPRVFSILVDTSSRVSNFSPAPEFDPSDRISRGSVTLFHPYILSGYFDLFLKERWGENENLALKVSSQDYLKAGRPLVGELDFSDSTLSFLSKKLNYGKDLPLEKHGPLSHALCRLATEISPSHTVASNLVANNMCTLLATNVHRNAFIVSYVAEPKLAIAAATVWNLQRYLCGHILPALQESLASGLLGQGLQVGARGSNHNPPCI